MYWADICWKERTARILEWNSSWACLAWIQGQAFVGPWDYEKGCSTALGWGRHCFILRDEDWEDALDLKWWSGGLTVACVKKTHRHGRDNQPLDWVWPGLVWPWGSLQSSGTGELVELSSYFSHLAFSVLFRTEKGPRDERMEKASRKEFQVSCW